MAGMMPVTVVVPVLRRPQNAGAFMASIAEGVSPDTSPPPVIAVANVDDERTAQAWRRAGAKVIRFAGQPGSFGQKANYAARWPTVAKSEWMFLVGDDVAFHRGWLEEALRDLRPETCMVGVSEIPPDAVMDRRRISPGYEATLRSAEHTNHMLIRMDYIRERGASWDGPGTVCGPYRHWFTNNELTMVARMRGVWEARPKSIVEHLHPYFGRGEMDEVYRVGELNAQADGELWMERVRKFAPELLEV
jgi:glycosyltransferase involved in cell wall biosynthesis